MHPTDQTYLSLERVFLENLEANRLEDQIFQQPDYWKGQMEIYKRIQECKANKNWNTKPKELFRWPCNRPKENCKPTEFSVLKVRGLYGDC